MPLTFGTTRMGLRLELCSLCFDAGDVLLPSTLFLYARMEFHDHLAGKAEVEKWLTTVGPFLRAPCHGAIYRHPTEDMTLICSGDGITVCVF